MKMFTKIDKGINCTAIVYKQDIYNPTYVSAAQNTKMSSYY
jgi:hypothetical protein